MVIKSKDLDVWIMDINLYLHSVFPEFSLKLTAFCWILEFIRLKLAFVGEHVITKRIHVLVILIMSKFYIKLCQKWWSSILRKYLSRIGNFVNESLKVSFYFDIDIVHINLFVLTDLSCVLSSICWTVSRSTLLNWSNTAIWYVDAWK